MDKRLRDIIHTLDYHELLKIRKDLDSGGYHLKEFVTHEIDRRNKSHSVYCTTCGAEIDAKSHRTMTMVFGPSDFRKKATFCGKDCLEFFLKKLDEQKKQPISPIKHA
ncbi:MAG: hypothetical protein ACMXYE_01635 [Candidatus Woesearchaeota archaeon]